ncbi:Ribosomal protein L34Ae [Macleaya cordata]|uniref:Ribosomal protein L34Ae n=1 Tax=Macleaya cordata TaxID=56857 RepID=A0A200QH47_MACCD|nr:Ribosomal protein L34Ae [Macleaya cordata]
MVYFRSSTSTCNSFDHNPINMASPLSLTDPSFNSKHNFQQNRNRKQPSSPKSLMVPPCGRSRTAAVDLVILIAVIGAFGFLIYPYVRMIFHGIVGIGGITISVVKYEVCRAPMVYVSLGLSIFFAIMAAWVISKCTNRKCGNRNCLGLRKAAEFDIQIETEDCVKNSSPSVVKDGGGKGLFELSIDHHRELEAELRKIAPPNGRAVLLFRARCGCSIGRMEVPGPKKLRKIKK